jgi:hypothetical protein
MRRADRRRWKQAITLADLGELVIAWLNGEVTQTPGHLGSPCDETIQLIPALTVLNRAGFVTDNSQRADTRGDRTWNTWVSGFTSDEVLGRLDEAVAGTPLLLTACRGCHHECDQRADEWWHCPWKDAADFWAERCPRMGDELYGCWYVAVSDPEPGRNDLLWPALERIARP